MLIPREIVNNRFIWLNQLVKNHLTIPTNQTNSREAEFFIGGFAHFAIHRNQSETFERAGLVVGRDHFAERVFAVSGAASHHEEDSALVWRQPSRVDDVRAFFSVGAIGRLCAVRPHLALDKEG